MKVLKVSCEGLGNGGVQNVIMNICRNIPDAKFDIILFTSERRHYDNEFEMLGGKIFRINKYEGSSRFIKKIDSYYKFIRIFTNTYKIVKKNGPYDVIHCHNELESGICNLAAYFAGIKIRIAHAHTADDKYLKSNVIKYILKKGLQSLMNLTSNIKISCTKKALVNLFGKRYYEDDNSFIIPNPIDTKWFKKTNDKSIREKGINIIHIGRYCQNKNQMLLVNILPLIANSYPNIRLQLIGSGDEHKEQLQNKAESLGVTSRVEFLPADSNVKEVLENASIFVFPSITEGFGIAALEAQAMEVPCLVSDTVPKEVDCGLCEFLPLSESREVWAQEVVNILRNNYRMKLNWDKLHSLDIECYTQKIKSIYGG
ncbi:glycosyltransferase [Alkalihalobacterium alkalinitrilicum]|uniref:glycosyltransferase n=1 Tax=Alkalihalobacterium alkalinitrilicum TaxID=427920 RepID=UPI0009953BD7|nr:glycosyltransferase [Alkalihalobacterium alkalinitrilicum]